jgi:hypothetical protein
VRRSTDRRPSGRDWRHTLAIVVIQVRRAQHQNDLAERQLKIVENQEEILNRRANLSMELEPAEGASALPLRRARQGRQQRGRSGGGPGSAAF